MFKYIFMLGIGLALMQPWQLCQAESYPAEYRSGYPGFNGANQTGQLNVDTDGVRFESKDGRNFLVPLDRIREQGYESQNQPKGGTGFAIAGPNPILLASTLGASLIGNIIMHPRTESHHFYKLSFLGDDQALHEITFQVPTQEMPKQIMADVRDKSKAEYYNVMMQRETAPTPPPEPTPATEAAATMMPEQP